MKYLIILMLLVGCSTKKVIMKNCEPIKGTDSFTCEKE